MTSIFFKPRALTDTTSSRRKRGQSHRYLIFVSRTHFIGFRQNIIASNELFTEQFYFRNTMHRTNLAVVVAGMLFGIAGEMRRLPAYFDNPDYCTAG